MNDLKPCPFCGGEAEILTAESMYGGNLYGVLCDCCAGRTDVFDTEAEAIEAWNTRADDYRHAAEYWQRMYEQVFAERTCKVIEMHEHVTMDEPDIAELSCGHDIMVFDMEPQNYCPNCGAKVVSE